MSDDSNCARPNENRQAPEEDFDDGMEDACAANDEYPPEDIAGPYGWRRKRTRTRTRTRSRARAK